MAMSITKSGVSICLAVMVIIVAAALWIGEDFEKGSAISSVKSLSHTSGFSTDKSISSLSSFSVEQVSPLRAQLELMRYESVTRAVGLGASLDQKLTAYLSDWHGPLVVYGWQAERVGENWIVSFSFDQGEGTEGFYYEVSPNNVIRYLNSDIELMKIYHICLREQSFMESWQPKNEWEDYIKMLLPHLLTAGPCEGTSSTKEG